MESLDSKAMASEYTEYGTIMSHGEELADVLRDLDKRVNEAMEKFGAQPLGGVSVAWNAEEFFATQALAKPLSVP